MQQTAALLVAVLLVSVIVAEGQRMGGLHVQGNKIYNQDGQQVRLRGVDRSGAEFMCIQGQGFFDGPTDQASINAIKSWRTNAVRVPLNEDCWLGINGVPSQYSGYYYRLAIEQWVNRLTQNNLAVILDLHWTAPGNQQARGQQPMPDLDHAPSFWTSVAATFKNNTGVIFDLFNEPYPGGNTWDSTEAWQCWRDGGSCSGIPFQVAGMQTLVNAVRSTGSQNIVMLGGLMYSNSLVRWLDYMPHDPTGNTAASWHSYNFNECSNQNCWDSVIAPVGAKVPLIAGEIGENDCNSGYINPLMNWLDSHGFSYLAWTWNTWNCNSGPALITSYDGTPTNFGQGYKQHLASLQE